MPKVKEKQNGNYQRNKIINLANKKQKIHKISFKPEIEYSENFALLQLYLSTMLDKLFSFYVLHAGPVEYQMNDDLITKTYAPVIENAEIVEPAAHSEYKLETAESLETKLEEEEPEEKEDLEGNEGDEDRESVDILLTTPTHTDGVKHCNAGWYISLLTLKSKFINETN